MPVGAPSLSHRYTCSSGSEDAARYASSNCASTFVRLVNWLVCRSTSDLVMLVHSWILARTAATAELGGPLPGSSDPIASQVVFTQDASGVPRAACSAVLSHKRLRIEMPHFSKFA